MAKDLRIMSAWFIMLAIIRYPQNVGNNFSDVQIILATIWSLPELRGFKARLDT